MRVEVECYAGYKGAQRPTCFRMGGRQYSVEELLDQWYGPEDTWFRVRADDGNLYILRHTAGVHDDLWTLESFSADSSRHFG